MEKALNEITEKQEVTEWFFPKMELVVHSVQPSHEREQNESEEKIDSKVLEDQAAKLEIENIKKEYFRKIAVLNQILGQIERPLAVIDKELVDVLQEILKASIKKIVFKELQTDPELMKNMIDNLCLLIQAQEGVLNVFLSEEDFKKISADFTRPNTILKVNSSLTEGDIIVKSSMSEIHAVLADRVNQLLGIKND